MRPNVAMLLVDQITLAAVANRIPVLLRGVSTLLNFRNRMKSFGRGWVSGESASS